MQFITPLLTLLSVLVFAGGSAGYALENTAYAALSAASGFATVEGSALARNVETDTSTITLITTATVSITSALENLPIVTSSWSPSPPITASSTLSVITDPIWSAHVPTITEPIWSAHVPVLTPLPLPVTESTWSPRLPITTPSSVKTSAPGTPVTSMSMASIPVYKTNTLATPYTLVQAPTPPVGSDDASRSAVPSLVDNTSTPETVTRNIPTNASIHSGPPVFTTGHTPIHYGPQNVTTSHLPIPSDPPTYTNLTSVVIATAPPTTITSMTVVTPSLTSSTATQSTSPIVTNAAGKMEVQLSLAVALGLVHGFLI
ncbi:uncharacterized protein BP5553_06839 [Venustampulla echinocandica]|uniref:Uncharacterized protein n=1 Tax=Venustampulla echinocandica TaxID=2656787 RepID=A0A370TL58_9HELO|nr:uncharacterized protein BP5553_06839 [Venustampulla echinocandica]RDL36227.1 hypothetical protein BP5553_06839 [Venustampulla echinocandica]